ncbi:MAG: hypothetical protein GEU74_09850 [Nitriliruptorales bacterium]|nr:hypothetical protein [Nitriliruptorales bacterium]
MQLPLSDARAVRMLQALLAAADPLGRLDRGAPAWSYDTVAVATLARLREGACEQDVVLLLHGHARADVDEGEAAVPQAIVAFARAAADWWDNAQGRWTPRSAGITSCDAEDRKPVPAGRPRH